jgi:hypothetical protein
MRKPWERPQEPEEEEEDSPEMARAMGAYYRKIRIIFVFILPTCVGLVLLWWAWHVALNKETMPVQYEARGFRFAAICGPGALWMVGVRVILSAMMLGDDELRTEEQDIRDQRLWALYQRPNPALDSPGAILGFINFAIVKFLI